MLHPSNFDVLGNLLSFCYLFFCSFGPDQLSVEFIVCHTLQTGDITNITCSPFFISVMKHFDLS